MLPLAVCIPTRNDQDKPGKIHFSLLSLAMQTYKEFTVYIRDEGLRDIFADDNIRMILNLLEQKNITVHYIRTQERCGVAYARRSLFESIGSESFLLWLDDDMVIEPDSIARLMTVIQSDKQIGFVQGVKKELNPFRKYLHDINVLNGSDQPLLGRVRIYFGDAAFLLMRTECLQNVDWDLITRYPVDGLPGEDVTMSLLVAQNWEGWGIPEAMGWHISPHVERWAWEISSDVLQVELLNGQVDPDILRKALPHLAEFIKSPLNEKESKESE